MCRTPVTFGGGIMIVNVSFDGSSEGENEPESSHLS